MSGVVFLLAGAVFLCGCTGSPGEGGTSSPEITVITASSTAAPEEIPSSGDDIENPDGADEWIVWREGSNTLNPLGDFVAYGPNVNAEKFRALKVEVRSQYPVTVLFLNDRKVSNFKTKMATNAGEFTPIARYDEVNYQVIEVEADEDLNVVVWNQGNRLTVADFYIWYRNPPVE